MVLEVKILRRREDFLELEADGEDPSVFDSLSELMLKMEGVEYAGVTIEHPLTRKIILRVRTDPSKIKAEEALRKAVKELQVISRELRERFEAL